MMRKTQWGLVLSLGLLLALLAPTVITAQELPRVEVIVAIKPPITDEIRTEVLNDITARLGSTVSGAEWLDNSRIHITLPYQTTLGVNELRAILETDVQLDTPIPNPAVLLEFVDFSDIAAEQILEGACILTTEQIALADSAQAGIMEGGIIAGQFTEDEVKLLANQLNNTTDALTPRVERIEIVFVE